MRLPSFHTLIAASALLCLSACADERREERRSGEAASSSQALALGPVLWSETELAEADRECEARINARMQAACRCIYEKSSRIATMEEFKRMPRDPNAIYSNDNVAALRKSGTVLIATGECALKAADFVATNLDESQQDKGLTIIDSGSEQEPEIDIQAIMKGDN